MKYRSFVLWTIACGFAVLPLRAQDFEPVANPEHVYGLLKASAAATRSIRADFQEVREVSYLKAPQKSSGVFSYAQKDRMRWEQTRPSSYIILINGSNLRVSEGGKEKNVASARKMAGRIRDMLLSIVSGEFQSDRNFSKECFQNEALYRIVLTPLDKRLRQLYDKIELRFSRKNLVLKQLSFLEKSGDRQVMTFTNEKINAPIADTVFEVF